MSCRLLLANISFPPATKDFHKERYENLRNGRNTINMSSHTCPTSNSSEYWKFVIENDVDIADKILSYVTLQVDALQDSSTVFSDIFQLFASKPKVLVQRFLNTKICKKTPQ